jgi:hypothetical protein
MRQQVSEANELFPVRLGAGKAVIEPAIDHNISPHWV